MSNWVSPNGGAAGCGGENRRGGRENDGESSESEGKLPEVFDGSMTGSGGDGPGGGCIVKMGLEERGQAGEDGVVVGGFGG